MTVIEINIDGTVTRVVETADVYGFMDGAVITNHDAVLCRDVGTGIILKRG